MPDRAIVLGLPAALCASVMLAPRAPVTDGVKVTLKVADLPAVIVSGVVGAVSTKSALFVPPRVTFEITRSAVPVF